MIHLPTTPGNRHAESSIQQSAALPLTPSAIAPDTLQAGMVAVISLSVIGVLRLIGLASAAFLLAILVMGIVYRRGGFDWDSASPMERIKFIGTFGGIVLAVVALGGIAWVFEALPRVAEAASVVVGVFYCLLFPVVACAEIFRMGARWFWFLIACCLVLTLAATIYLSNLGLI